MAMSPMDNAVPASSKTASHVTPLLRVRNTPPDAVPTKMIRGSLGTASMSSTRPPNEAGPICRQAESGHAWPTLCCAPADDVATRAPTNATRGATYIAAHLTPSRSCTVSRDAPRHLAARIEELDLRRTGRVHTETQTRTSHRVCKIQHGLLRPVASHQDTHPADPHSVLPTDLPHPRAPP